ncbi:MAG: chromosomal replication initiator protein DnaA [Bryobacterales bacterium]|nr:chromosomal replication initiator protein DnaA [Bryobacterales bacterium]
MNTWEQIKRELRRQLTQESYQNWILHSRQTKVSGQTLWVEVPSLEIQAWLETEYAGMISDIIGSLGLPVDQVAYHLPELATSNGEATFHGVSFESPPSPLNPKFTFDNFVVGPCNQFAQAAAKAVATMPSRRYNPLFLYGGTGMGKTHLMHAVGRSLMDNFTGMRIVYTSSERFMNEMISCIRLDRMPQFHAHYRSADVLIVDDVHGLAGKERTQEEFFHTFNTLYDHQKQIILSSDSTPKDIPNLVERLRSRFEWGLMVDMQPPDLETKIAILDKKAEAEGITLPDDVRIFIATKTKSNVRELEGALTKLMALSSLTGAPINLQMAQQILKHLVHAPDKRVSIDAIQRQVAEHYGLRPGQLKERTNAHKISYPRQVAMYLVKELTTSSLPEIGRAFGGKHHTTVLHSVNKIEQLRQVDSDLDRLLHKLIDRLQ